MLVSEADHPFWEHWWPHGHIIGWEHSFVHELHHLLTAIAEDSSLRRTGRRSRTARPPRSATRSCARASRAGGRRSRIASPRLNRLFAADGRCFDVAVDHGFFGERSFLAGIEDLERAVRTLVDAGPDAIQLSPGEAPLLQELAGPHKPALVLRTDVANVYGASPPSTLWSELVEDAAARALRLDAACVVVNLLSPPGEPELYRQCVRNVSKLRAAVSRSACP